MTSPVSAVDAIERFERAVAANGYRTCDDHTEAEYLAAKAALTAALSDQERAVEVKALEWDKTLGTYRGSERREQWRAKTPWGDFVIWHYQMIDDEAKRGPKFTVGSHMTPFPVMDVEFDTLDEAKAAAQADYEQRIRSALVDVPVEPVAHIIEGMNGEDPRVYLTQKYDPRRPDFWLNEEARARHRVTPLYTHPPHREGEDSAEVLRSALQRISELTPARANARDARDLHLTVKAIADVALAATRSGSATSANGGCDDGE